LAIAPGYLPLNIGAAVKLPPRKYTLAERALTEDGVVRMLALEADRRNTLNGALAVQRRRARVGAHGAQLARPDTGQVTVSARV
jgi:hypothetical protein